MSEKPDILTILGHTAAGKTLLAANVAARLGGEVISVDSRQVYRGMSIGTGKDYDDYKVEGKMVPFHLLDIVDAGSEYNVFEFQKDFRNIYDKLMASGILPVLCGGSGLYLESILRKYELVRVPVNNALRKLLEEKNLDDLTEILEQYRSLHNTTDTKSRKRVIRAIEIAEYMKNNEADVEKKEDLRSLNIGVSYDREERRSRITQRLKERLSSGMIEETERLLQDGISHEKLEYYGLEYKYLSRYLAGVISYEEMTTQLNTAIHQFAKRQMTYFRGMEKRGIKIHWIDGSIPMEQKIDQVLKVYKETI